MIHVDNRLDDAPMTPVSCRRCAAAVGVRKSSWQQTSIQWDEDAVALCAERDGHRPATGAVAPSCQALRESISEAAVSGAVPVQARVI
ncbi:ferredoxin [Saccharopolyspora sp. NPDC003752]